MTEPIVPPAGEPPEEPQGGSIPVQQQGKFYTTEELQSLFNGRLKEERETLEKQLGLSDLGLKIKDVKDILKAKKEADEAKKSELEKVTGERDTHKADAQVARLEAAKIRALAKAGADPEKIDALLKRVVGNTPEEIEADVKELADLGLLAVKTAAKAAQGAGQTGIQRQSSSLSGMTRAELAEKSKDRVWYEANRDAIMKALENKEIK